MVELLQGRNDSLIRAWGTADIKIKWPWDKLWNQNHQKLTLKVECD